jgi:drug/metabolite transporter (DMT)-like permease
LALIWGSSFLFMKVGLRWVAPPQIATVRVLLGALTVTLLLHLLGGRLPRSREVWLHLLVVGFLLACLPFVLFPLGEERVSSALAGIGNATTPLATVVATAAMLPAERLPARKVLAVVAGFAGVLVIAQPWQAAGRPDLLGFGFTLVAGMSYGVGWTWVRKYLSRHDLGGLQLPAALLLVASAQMVLVLSVWWLLHRDTVESPWSPTPGATGGWAPRARGPRHGSGLPAAVRRGAPGGPARGIAGHVPDPRRVGGPRLPAAGGTARCLAAGRGGRRPGGCRRRRPPRPTGRRTARLTDPRA